MATTAPSKDQWDQLESGLDAMIVHQIAMNFPTFIPVNDDGVYPSWIYKAAEAIASNTCVMLERTGWGLRGADTKKGS